MQTSSATEFGQQQEQRAYRDQIAQAEFIKLAGVTPLENYLKTSTNPLYMVAQTQTPVVKDYEISTTTPVDPRRTLREQSTLSARPSATYSCSGCYQH
jgi:hypothetical protein